MKKIYLLKTAVSPMDNADLAANFNTMRHRYWISKGLYFPADVTVVFGNIRENRPASKRNGKSVGALRYVRGKPKIILTPEHAHLYFASKLTLLHEMAHIYIQSNFGCRYYGHGKMFNTEIDRLYSIGAFQKLI